MALVVGTPHRALYIFDILEQIFKELDPVHRGIFEIDMDGACVQALGRASRVCTAWTVPALNILWMNLIGMEPLFCVFSALYERYRVDRTRAKLRQGLPAEGWLRFREYMRRVRTLYINNRDFGDEVKLRHFGRIAYTNGIPIAPMAPRLETLKWEATPTIDELHYLTMIAPTTLKHIIITRRSGPILVHYPGLVLHLKQMFPDLESMSILAGWRRPLPDLVPFTQFGTLRSIELYVRLTPEQWYVLSSLQSLRQVTALVFGLRQLSPEIRGFPNVEAFVCIMDDWEDVSWVNTISSRCLKTLLVRYASQGPVHGHLRIHVTGALETMCARFGDTLRDISLVTSFPIDRESPFDFLRMLECINPLFRLRGIERFRVIESIKSSDPKYDIQDSLTDRILGELSTAWPKPRGLRLEAQCPGREYYSTDALAKLAQRCPELEILGLGNIKLSTLPTPRCEGSTIHHLRNLFIGHYTGDAGDMASRLLAIFPSATVNSLTRDEENPAVKPAYIERLLSLVEEYKRTRRLSR
ncbi:hypothetical protein CERSUDRAFT_95521 [Gelatoporia subvermispora B]|uniref:F-box domain-containing protein n=1 Tax=Ceriporiopsis subvermispora (strain B) TaxID=914234 RepID=M2QVP4_CERS8|nr:hypothetical protein CERSUDRAFT_95521 [Gelatoporia subvermispora B]